MTLFIQNHILQKLGQFLLQKSEVHLSCKMTFQEERTKQLIVQNCTPHIDTKTLLKVAFHSGVGIAISPHMRGVCIINTVMIELWIVSKQDVTMQLATAIEPLAKFPPFSIISRYEMLHSLHMVWIHALCTQCSPHFRVGNTKTSHNSSSTLTWTALYHLNNGFFFIDAFINITFSCNANAVKCTGISQCLVNSSKHSSGWYSMARKMLLIFCYSLNWITITKTVHINHICILCNQKCKRHCERYMHRNENTYRTNSTLLLLPPTPLRNYRHTVLYIRCWHSHCNVSDKGFWTPSSSGVIQYTLARRISTHPAFPAFLKYLPSVVIWELDCL